MSDFNRTRSSEMRQVMGETRVNFKAFNKQEPVTDNSHLSRFARRNSFGTEEVVPESSDAKHQQKNVVPESSEANEGPRIPPVTNEDSHTIVFLDGPRKHDVIFLPKSQAT
jgi:hypothetical protein